MASVQTIRYNNMKINHEGRKAMTEAMPFQRGNPICTDSDIVPAERTQKASIIIGMIIIFAGWGDLKKRIIRVKSREFSFLTSRNPFYICQRIIA